MKNILLDILNNDTSYNKSATRYLYKTHPDLWQEVIKITSFLPDSALPKQRIWHVLNDVWSIPTCPITGQQVKWYENRYLKTFDRSSKTQWQHARGDFIDLYSEEKNEKRRMSNLNAVKRGRKYRSKETYTEQQKQRNRQTCLERYGVPNGGQSRIARQKVSNATILNGATPRHLRSLRRLYYDAVWQFTEQSWKYHFDQINPTRIDRSQNALDHIYSIQQGFRDNIPPYIIGHWTNLRIIALRENSLKGMRCDKTQDALFGDFFTNSL
jgi:hypothetical protein